jgi:D-3-phosphoglycerate dehydrogenase / 2-oxoglutarate reductase
MKILFADTAHPHLKGSLELSGFICDDLIESDLEKIKVIIKAYDGVVIRSKFKFDKEMLDATENLRFIARVGAGMENIDVSYAESKGIRCLHAPEGNRNAVAEQALGMLLNLMNNIRKADEEVRRGEWIREGNRGVELEGKTVGLIGFGNTGSSMARKLSGFDVKILAYDPHLSEIENPQVELVSMDEIHQNCDVISLHVPLTEETRYMVNKDWLSRFKKPIWLINTARGKCLKTLDLLDAIDAGKVLGAGLDVLEFESLSFENLDASPELISRLRQHPKLLLTPHIAGWTHESNIKLADVLYTKIMALTTSQN